MPKKWKWYYTASLSVHNSPLYDRILARIWTELPAIAMQLGFGECEIISARGMYTSGRDWVEKWPSVCETIDGGLFFTVDATSHIGKGVHTEVVNILEKGLPVYLVTHDGAVYPISSLAGDAFIDGPDFTYYTYIDIPTLEKGFRDASRLGEVEEPTDLPYKLYIFGVDGTVSTTKSGETFRKTADDWQLLPGRAEKLQQLKRRGARLALASNQGGVAFGHMKQENILRELQTTAKALDVPPGGVYICYTHPKAILSQYRINEDRRRKPGPGMLEEAMSDFEADEDETLYVGDRPEDEEAAKNAGVAFMWAKDFFGDEA